MGNSKPCIKKQLSAVSDTSVIKVTIKHNGITNNLESIPNRPSTDVSTEETRLLVNDGNDQASGPDSHCLPDTSLNLENKVEIQESLSNCDQNAR